MGVLGRPAGAEHGCAKCPHMRQGSSFDGVHLFCELANVWTNLLSGRFAGSCIVSDEPPEPRQLTLF